jgi:hypothetical protein
MGHVEKASEFYLAARIRARRRHSAWNLLLIPLGIAGWLGTWYLLFRLVWAVHHLLYPQHLLSNFWGKGIGLLSFVPSFLMVFAPASGALCLGLLIANCLVWLFPSARKELDAEAIGYPGTGFKEASASLIRWVGWTLPTGMLIAIIAASVLRSLR